MDRGALYDMQAHIFLTRLFTKLTILLTHIFLFHVSVNSCQVDECWNRYGIAMEALESHNPQYAKCVAIRTYSYCIRNMTRGCIGIIRFHTIQKAVENQMNTYNCTIKGHIFNGTRPPPTSPQEPDIVCSYKGKPSHRHCGLFGDPHLRTFDNDFQTCKVKGAWPLIDNEHLTVQVTNDPVVGNGHWKLKHMST